MSTSPINTEVTTVHKPTEDEGKNYFIKLSNFNSVTDKYSGSTDKNFLDIIDDATANLAEAEARIAATDLCITHIKNIKDSGLKEKTIQKCRELFKNREIDFKNDELDQLEAQLKVQTLTKAKARKICDPDQTPDEELFY